MCTPSTSEDEDEDNENEEETPILNPPTSPHILQLLLNMLAVVFPLTRETEYTYLYHQRDYVEKMKRKLKKMKRNAKRINFEIIYRDPCFWTHLLRIQRTYVDDGGRAFLNQLVALESHLTTEYESESESETDTDDNDETQFQKIDKFQGGGNNGNDGNAGGQMILV